MNKPKNKPKSRRVPMDYRMGDLVRLMRMSDVPIRKLIQDGALVSYELPLNRGSGSPFRAIERRVTRANLEKFAREHDLPEIIERIRAETVEDSPE